MLSPTSRMKCSSIPGSERAKLLAITTLPTVRRVLSVLDSQNASADFEDDDWMAVIGRASISMVVMVLPDHPNRSRRFCLRKTAFAM